MRTTIRIDDELYRMVKARAARAGRTVAEVIEDALRAAMVSDALVLSPISRRCRPAARAGRCRGST